MTEMSFAKHNDMVKTIPSAAVPLPLSVHELAPAAHVVHFVREVLTLCVISRRYPRWHSPNQRPSPKTPHREPKPYRSRGLQTASARSAPVPANAFRSHQQRVAPCAA